MTAPADPVARGTADAALIRRLESANLSAWPADCSLFDGAWLLRRTASHASKRLNCLSFLDPADDADVAGRMAAALADFARHGAAPVVRVTPLTPPAVVAHLDAAGWERFDETRTMTADLSGLDGAVVTDAAVHDDGPRSDWAAAMKRTGSAKAKDVVAVIALLERILPEVGLSVAYDRHTGAVAATALAVVDRGLVGLFDVGTVVALRRRGFGRRAILGALAWGHARGADIGWLQVMSENARAITLYERIGFTEVYRGDYRRPPTTGAKP